MRFFAPDGRELPHPDVPCICCKKLVMGEQACPNYKNECTDCCGCH